jgi:hypothetical protein
MHVDVFEHFVRSRAALDYVLDMAEQRWRCDIQRGLHERVTELQVVPVLQKQRFCLAGGRAMIS